MIINSVACKCGLLIKPENIEITCTDKLCIIQFRCTCRRTIRKIYSTYYNNLNTDLIKNEKEIHTNITSRGYVNQDSQTIV